MGLFDKLKEPVFLKESSDAHAQLEKLYALEALLNEDGKSKLRQEIKFLEYGIAGEKNIAFELKNSHMPMYILHDLYLESDDLSAQIDYLVITRSLCFVIECKNLVGDIEINSSGDFIRTMEYGGKKKKEGIYSPITQNQRHLQLMKKIKIDKNSNVLTKMLANRFFESFNKSIVVLANPKTILNAKYAKKEVKDQIIRADQLVKYIKDTCKNNKELDSSDSEMLNWAQSYLKLHIEKEHDYTAKFNQYMKVGASINTIEQAQKVISETVKERFMPIENIEETAIFKDLKEYRLLKSREEKIKPYFIYNDNQLKDLISKWPSTLDDLKTVSGFGDVKVEKYGMDILGIVSKYR